MEEKEKPKLNDARYTSLGSYRALYDIRAVDEEKKIWKGRPIIDFSMQKMPGVQKASETAWVFFSREYDDRNDWDRLYHEIEIDDEEILGQPFILVPKEKILFAYDPPPVGIILPHPGICYDKPN